MFEPSVVHSIHYFRVILDEAHFIKDRSSSTARAMFGLQRTHGWLLSGTPLQNRVVRCGVLWVTEMGELKFTNIHADGFGLKS